MNKKVIVGSMISFIAILSFTAIYIGSRLSETPSTAPETSKAFIDDETKIDYQFYGANGTCSLVRKNNTLCLQYTGSYNQFSKHWCHGDWGDNGSGCSCPASGYGSGAGKCATNYSPKPGLSFPGEDPKCFDGQFGIQNCNPEIYFNHSNTYPDNYADTVCLDKSWCEFQQIDILVGSTGNYTCFLSGYMGGTDVCNASPTPKPSNTPTITPTTPLTITPTVTKTITPTNTLTITGTLTVTPSVTHTITPTITQTITSTPIITPTITIIVTTPPASITVTTIPKTALISDTVDMTIIGIILIIFGSVIYGSGYYLKLGNGFWEKAGGRELWESSNNLFTQTKTTIHRVIKNSKEAIYNYFHDDKTAYEKKVIKDRKSKSN